MAQNARRAYPQDPETQGTLKTGPTGVVHRGPEPRTDEELPGQPRVSEGGRTSGLRSGETRPHQLVWMAVAYYASLQPCRTCYARVDTLAKKAKGLSTRTVQRKLHELADGWATSIPLPGLGATEARTGTVGIQVTS